MSWAEEFVRRFCRYFDDFIFFPGYPPFPEQQTRVRELPGFLKKCQARRFDLVLQMHGDGHHSNPLVALLGAERTAGYAADGAFIPPNGTFFKWPAEQHEIWKYLELIKSLGLPTDGEHLEFPLNKKDQDEFEDLLNKENLKITRFICIHPGSSVATRRWLPERFGAIANHFANLGYQIVLTGTKSEKEIGQKLIRTLKHPFIDLMGKTNLGQLSVLIQKAKLMIANDTGVSHIAAALNRPSIILVTGSDPGRWAPLDHRLHKTVFVPVKCRPCSFRECPNGMVCMRRISNEMVINAFDELSWAI